MVIVLFLKRKGFSLDKRHKRNVLRLSTLPTRLCAGSDLRDDQRSDATGERLLRKVNLEWARQF